MAFSFATTPNFIFIDAQNFRNISIVQKIIQIRGIGFENTSHIKNKEQNQNS
jgi:hypothetical protein